MFVKGKSKNKQSKNCNKPFSNEEKKVKQKKMCKYSKMKRPNTRMFFLKRKNQEKEKDSKRKQPEVSIVESSFTYTDALASTLDQANHVNPLEKHDWILDSGCTYHMTPFRAWFNNNRKINGESVFMGNNNACNIVGIGSATMKLNDGTVKLLRNVRHVPHLKRNLISLGMLDSLGCEYKGKCGVFQSLYRI